MQHERPIRTELHINNRSINMVVLTSAVEGRFDVKRAQCN